MNDWGLGFGSLRQVLETLSPKAAAIVQRVGRADFPAAFQMMKTFGTQLDSGDRDLLILTESEYHEHNRLKTEGTSTQEHPIMLVAEVRRNVLELAKKLD